MSRLCVGAILAVALVMRAAAWQGSGTSARSEAVEADLIRINAEIEKAVLARDVAFLDAIAAADFVFTHGDASAADGGRPLVDTKATWLAAARNTRTPFVARDISVDRVELHDDVALINGAIRVRSESQDVSFRNYTISFVRVFAQRGGKWQLLSHRTVRTSRTNAP